MTPVQRSMPRNVQDKSYERVPMTCDETRAVLDVARREIMEQLDIELHDEVIVDIILSRAFINIRDSVAHKFRDDHMRLINEFKAK